MESVLLDYYRATQNDTKKVLIEIAYYFSQTYPATNDQTTTPPDQPKPKV